MTGKVICVANRKGGVGKTTTAIVLAQTLQTAGYSVVVVDVDPQGSATYALASDDFRERLAPLFFERQITESSGGRAWGQISSLNNRPDVALALVPCSEQLWALEDTLGNPLAAAQIGVRWRQLLKRLRREYRVIIIDTPPGRSFFGRKAMRAADLVLVPCDATRLAVRAMAIFAKELRAHRLEKKAKLLWTKQKGSGGDELAILADELKQVLDGAGALPIPSIFEGSLDEQLGGLHLSPTFSKGVVRTDARSFESVYPSQAGIVARALRNAVLRHLGLGAEP